MRIARARRRWKRPIVALVAILVAYYAIPIGEFGQAFLFGILVTTVGVGLLGWAILGQTRRLAQDDTVDLPFLTMLVGLVIFVFALGYFALDLSRPSEMADLETRTDSLYFTMQVATTVGLGDVHPEGQIARGVVILQMAFDVVFIAVAGGIIAGSVRDRMASGPPREPRSRRRGRGRGDQDVTLDG